MPFPYTLIKTKKLPEQRLIKLINDYNIDCILDVGANKGQYAENMRKLGYAGHIVSFEPTSNARDVLIAKADQDAHWDIAPQMALGDKGGEVKINVSEADDMSSILELSEQTLDALPESRVAKTETVTVQTLDSLYDQYTSGAQNVFLKLDTQGYEWPIIKGARSCLSKITGIQAELSLFSLYKNEKTFEDVSLALRPFGFEPVLVIPGYFSRKLNRQMQIDIIFFRV